MTRELPQNEWPRLAETYLKDVWTLLPTDTRVIVVEDEAQIVGTCALLSAVHAEGLSVADTHRQNGMVFKRLLQTVAQTAMDMGKLSVICGAMSVEMEDYLTRLGGVRSPVTLFAMPLDGVLRHFQGAKEN